MEKSFRDILSQFLEEKEVDSPSETAPSSSFTENTSSPFEPLWHPQFSQNPSREGVLRYKSQVKTQTSESAPKVEVAPPPPIEDQIEELTPLEKLDKDARIMVGILIELGATECKDGVSLHRIKKAYRRLVKTYHPDRVNKNSSERQAEAAKVAFFRLQKAYEFLCEYFEPTDAAHDQAA